MPIMPPNNTPILSYATNDMSAGDVFYQRQKYKFFVYPVLGSIYNFNFWEQDKFYGRVSPKGFTGAVSEDSLKQLRETNGDTLFANAFIADAWRDFTDQVKELNQAGTLARGGVWSAPKAAKAWRCAYDSYHEYMVNVVYIAFADTYMNSQKAKSQLKVLRTFLKVFGSFAQQVVKDGGPVTFSGFLESPYSSVLNTGLAIEIADDNHGDDLPKAKKFLYDPNYELVISIASQYGFIPDKNAPWRLVGDVENPAMQEYMAGIFMYQDPINPLDDAGQCDDPILTNRIAPEPYGFCTIPGFENIIRHAPGYPEYAPLIRDSSQGQETLFTGSYISSWENDLNILRLYLLDFYNRYIEDNPYNHSVTPPLPGCSISKIEVTERKVAEEAMFRGPDAPYGDKWALKATYNLRLLERGLSRTKARRTKDIRDFMNVYYLTPGSSEQKYYQSLRYINTKLIGSLTTRNLTDNTVGDINNRDY